MQRRKTNHWFLARQPSFLYLVQSLKTPTQPVKRLSFYKNLFQNDFSLVPSHPSKNKKIGL